MANLDQIAGRVGKRLGIPKRSARVVLDTFFEEVSETLGREEPVAIHRFGRWYFTYQRNFDRDYYERYGALPEGDRLSVKICRFRFSARMRDSLNGIDQDIGLETSDLFRLDYKRRQIVTRIPEIRAGLRAAAADRTETERRTAAGITLGAILERLKDDL